MEGVTERTALIARPREQLRASSLTARLPTVLPGALIALAAATVVLTRLMILGAGFWEDEYYSVTHYISGGPAAIFGGWHYVPNDHMLFELLAWATSSVVSSQVEPVYRLWAVIPAIGAGVMMTWWLWRRADRWSAAVFAVLAAAAPNYYVLSTQARGYGLGFLAAVLLTVGADALLWRRSRAARALFAGGGLVGILTLPDFVLPFLAVAAVVALKPALRVTVIKTVAAVGVISLAWYAPVLTSVISSSNQQFGSRLPWYGFLTGPLKDQAAPAFTIVFRGLSIWHAVVLAGLLIAIGVIALWRVPDRLLVLLLLFPALFSYTVLDVSRRFVEDRFLSFLTLPLLAAAAIGIVAVGRLVARRGALAAAVVAVAIFGSLLALARTVQFGSSQAARPVEATKQVAAMIAGTKPPLPVVSNTQRPLGFQYYLRFKRKIHVLDPGQLQRLFCGRNRAFLYVDDTNHSTRADTSCLGARGAFEVNLPEQEATLALWFVPSTRSGSTAGGSGA
jgi:hypothetical protein